MHDDNDKIQELINDVGSFIEYWGFRKIHGKVWAKVYLSSKPLSTPEIVEGLDVSKALISGAINELLEHGLIEREGQVKYGGITYVACSNPAQVVREVIKNRELVLFNKIQNNLSLIEKIDVKRSNELNLNKTSIKNLKELTGYHKKMAQSLSKKNFKTMDEWIGFMRRISRFTF